MSAVVVQMPEKRPQTDDGFTRLANELLEALLCAGLSSRQWCVVMAVIRKTYGYNKTADDLGLGQLASMTGIDKAHLSRTVRELADAKVLHRTEGRHAFTLSLNKDYASWGLLKEQRLLKEQPPVADSATGWVADSATPPVAERATTKDNSSKDNYQKTLPKDKRTPAGARRSSSERADRTGRAVTSLNAEQQAAFDAFWQAYPSRKSKAGAVKAWAKLLPDAALTASIMAGLEASRQSEQWRKGVVPHAATWLNAERWTDEIATAFTADQTDVIEAYNAALGDLAGEIDADVFSEQRGAAINHFRALPGRKPQFWHSFFPWVRQNVNLPPHCGFDWLIDPNNFAAVRGGHHAKP